MFNMPEYLGIPPHALGADTPVTVSIVDGMHELADAMADAMLSVIDQAASEDRTATLIVPVGPVDQFPILAEKINDRKVDCTQVMFINMDEYLAEDGSWLPLDHPLSFRGFMNRKFFDRIDSALAPSPDCRVFPDPACPERIMEIIDERESVDACFGGIGINGHIAFNEPPEPGESISLEAFAELPTRVLDLSRETRTINSVTVGGDITIIPRRAITVGMKEILASEQIQLFCNRPWQSAVVRRVLHGPIEPACPSSLIRNHPNASLTMAQYVADVPQIMLR